MSNVSFVSTYIHAALHGSDSTELLPFDVEEDAQIVLDEIWKVLDSPVLPSASSLGVAFLTHQNRLRRLSLKIAIRYNKFPTFLVLRGVRCIDSHRQGAGAFADVFRGTHHGCEVALKCLRPHITMSNAQKEILKNAFYRESLLWKGLVHAHVLPFLGVTEDVFPDNTCMVIPWMENGNLRSYVELQRSTGRLDDNNFENLVVKWLRQTALGLAYLHAEGIVHGDLHAGNILVDSHGVIRLSDFGMSLVAEGTAYNYGSMHGGGATRWTAPELFDPEEFGLKSSRPTFQSDIYAFACTCVELYTGKPPFADLIDRQVPMRVVRGVRPHRPMLSKGQYMSEVIWSLMQSCWHSTIQARPSADAVVAVLADVQQDLTTRNNVLILSSLDYGVGSPSRQAKMQRYVDQIRTAVKRRIAALGDGEETKWLQRALHRTTDICMNGSNKALNWLLATKDHMVIPAETVLIRAAANGNEKTYAARMWSSRVALASPHSISIRITLEEERNDKVAGIQFTSVPRPQTHAWYELLVASPQHVRWHPVNGGSFTISTLGARPVDVSDPPEAASASWESPQDEWRAPWIVRFRVGSLVFPGLARCSSRNESLESSVFQVHDTLGNLHGMCDVLCYTD